MTDIVEEARALLAQATYGSEEWDTSAFPDTIKTADKRMFAAAPRLLAALADECERLSSALDAMTNQAVMASGRRATIVTDDGELERLRAENEQHVDFRASINEALPRPFGVTVLGAIAELRAENARLQAENARLREAMPTDEEWAHMQEARAEDKLNAECPDHMASNRIIDQWLARLDAAREGKMTMELTQQQIDQLAAMTITHGSHEVHSGVCIMEAIAVVTGAEWTDYPPCVPRDVARLSQAVNDGLWSSDEERTRAMVARAPYLVRCEDTADARMRRACIAAEVAREHAVASLRGRGVDTSAIDSLPVMTDRASCLAVRDVLRSYAAYAAAYEAAYASADAAAYDAAADAAAYAYEAAYAAAYEAAYAAAYEAAYASADAAAYDAAADAAEAADATRQSTRLRILDMWIGYDETRNGVR